MWVCGAVLTGVDGVGSTPMYQYSPGVDGVAVDGDVVRVERAGEGGAGVGAVHGRAVGVQQPRRAARLHRRVLLRHHRRLQFLLLQSTVHRS